MPETIHCPECGRQLRVPDELMGKRVKCPSCGSSFGAAAAVQDAGEPPEPAPAPPRPRRPSPPLEDELEEAPEEEYEGRRPRRPARRGGRARDAVSGPATALLVSGILGVVLSVCGIVANLTGAGMNAVVANAGGAPNRPGPRPDEAIANMFGGVLGAISGGIGLVVQGLVIFGAQKMKRLESYGWALTSAILTVIPCTTCCLWGLPIGIWSLVVLNREEVKIAFR